MARNDFLQIKLNNDFSHQLKYYNMNSEQKGAEENFYRNKFIKNEKNNNNHMT
jgi:hypothetical protein